MFRVSEQNSLAQLGMAKQERDRKSGIRTVMCRECDEALFECAWCHFNACKQPLCDGCMQEEADRWAGRR